MANPHVRPHMNFLPHIEGKHMSQAWHGYKMVHDISDNMLTPYLRVGNRIYYVNELVRRKNDYFLPLRWITYGPSKELYAMGYHTTASPVCLNTHLLVLIKYSYAQTVRLIDSWREKDDREGVNFPGILP
jgi:hypothetical protein